MYYCFYVVWLVVVVFLINSYVYYVIMFDWLTLIWFARFCWSWLYFKKDFSAAKYYEINLCCWINSIFSIYEFLKSSVTFCFVMKTLILRIYFYAGKTGCYITRAMHGQHLCWSIISWFMKIWTVTMTTLTIVIFDNVQAQVWYINYNK